MKLNKELVILDFIKRVSQAPTAVHHIDTPMGEDVRTTINAHYRNEALLILKEFYPEEII